MSNQEIERLESELAAAKAKHEARALFPKWVIPHRSHVTIDGFGHRVASLFGEQHIDRASNELSVLVKDEDEEARALSDVTPKAEPVADIQPEAKASIETTGDDTATG